MLGGRRGEGGGRAYFFFLFGVVVIVRIVNYMLVERVYWLDYGNLIHSNLVFLRSSSYVLI